MTTKTYPYGRVIGLAACLFFSVAGCDREESVLPKMAEQNRQAETAPQAGAADTAPNVTTATAATNGEQNERDEFLRKSRAEIDRLNARIKTLEEKAQSSGAELRDKMEKQSRALREDLKGVEKQWEKLKDSSASAWQDMKDLVSASIEKLQKAVDRATS